MKKPNLFKALIVLSGTGLTYLIYNLNEHLNVEYLLPIICALIVIFISTIFLLNKKVYGLKTIVVNPKLKTLLSGIKIAVLNTNLKEGMDSIIPQKIKNIKDFELFLWLLGASGFGIILGFYFKTFNSMALIVAMRQETKWKGEAYLDFLKANSNFFELKSNSQVYFDGDNFTSGPAGGFDFNWLYFFLGFISIMLLYGLIKKTTVISILKSKFRPYLK